MPALLRAFFVHEGIVVALYLEDTAVTLAFLFRDGVHLVPGFEYFAGLVRKLYAVGLFHVETGAGDDSAGFFAGLRLLFLEVDDGFAGAVHGFGIVGPLAVHEVAAVTVDFADGGVEVVHVAFHQLERGVVYAAVLAASVLPAGQKVPHVVGRYHVLPFDAFGALETFAVRVFARFEVATRKVDVLLVVVFAAAIESLLQLAVVHAAQLLARVAVVVVLRGCCRVDARFGERRENRNQGKRKNDGATHGLEGVNHKSNENCKDVVGNYSI